jgi:hypothetical protein
VAYDYPIVEVTATYTTAGHYVVVAAPESGLELVLHDEQYQLEANAATVETLLVQVGGTQAGATTRKRAVVSGAGDGLVRDYGAKERRLGAGNALRLDKSGGNLVGVGISYSVEPTA